MNELPPMRPMRILLIEDHADTLRLLTQYLEDLGHTVITARNLAEAHKVWPDCNCEVLLSDVGLSDGSGWEFLETAQPRRPVYAIAMSGFGMNADNARSREAGFRHHLLKPFKIAELEKLILEAANTGPGQ